MMIGPISGGHVNPAVSTSVAIAQRDVSNAGMLLAIIIAQLAGAYVGCQLTSLVGMKHEFGNKYNFGTAKLCPPPIIAKGDSEVTTGDKCAASGPVLWSAFAAEAYGTFLFTSVILAVKRGITVSKDLPANALAIACTLFCVCSMAAPISGAAINPAVGVIQTLYQAQHYKANSNDSKGYLGLTTMWVYVAGPLLGAVISGVLVQFS